MATVVMMPVCQPRCGYQTVTAAACLTSLLTDQEKDGVSTPRQNILCVVAREMTKMEALPAA